MNANENLNTFYNQGIKDKFLDTFDSPFTKAGAILIFRKSRETEEVLGKDIYDMTKEELGEVASALSCSTANAVYGNLIRIEEYIDWAIEEGLRKNNLSPLDRVDKVEWSKNFVATYRNVYFTRQDIEGMMDKLVNDMDKALLLALFEGIKGKAFSELANLKTEDITEQDGLHWVKLIDDDGEERSLQISELLANTLKNADRQSEYRNKNGEGVKKKRYMYSTLQESPYVFKKVAKGMSKDEKIDFAAITRKFLLFKEVFDLKHLKAKHIEDSGMMHLANEIQVDGNITPEQMDVIGDRFDTPYIVNGGVKGRNRTVIKRILDIKEFKGLYGYELTFNSERQLQN